jgi:hypothetical protein
MEQSDHAESLADYHVEVDVLRDEMMEMSEESCRSM